MQIPAADASPEVFLAWGRKMLALQPFSIMLGTRIHALSAGAAELHLPLTERLSQERGFAHGGVVGYLADSALAYAAGTAMRVPIVTSEFKINLLRPALGELLIARGQAVHVGRSQSVCRCDVYAVQNGVEKLCAAAQGTIVRLPSKA
jgi:uncharacterized protein (TIGR00369 family)